MAWSKSKYKELGAHWKDYYREYKVWRLMLYRCFDTRCKKYKYYGAKGIRVCERWANKDTGFINFYKDMGKAPIDENGDPYQLDRIDNTKGYSPKNCRWITRKENMRNRNDNVYIYICGDKYCASDACKLFGINRTTVTEAIRLRKKTPTEAFANALERRFS